MSFCLFLFFRTQVMCLVKSSCSTILVGFNSSRCRVWTTVGSKAAHELVEEAEEALQRVSPDTPTTWSVRVFLACSGASTISTVPYDGFSLRQRAAFKVKPKTAACETCTDKRTAVITNPNLKSFVSWSDLWLHWHRISISFFVICHPSGARPPRVWTDLSGWLTNCSAGLILVKSLTDWLIASDACFPACWPDRCKLNCPLAGWLVSW